MDRKEIFKNTIDKINYAHKIQHMCPANLGIEDLISSDDLAYIRGQFSSFDPELSRILHDGTPVAKINEYMSRRLNQPGRTPFNRFVALLTYQVFSAMQNYLDLANRAVNEDVTGDISTWQKLMDMMVVELNKLYQPDRIGAFVDIVVIDSWRQVGLPDDPYLTGQCMARTDNIIQDATQYYLVLNRKNINALRVKGSKDELKLLIEMVKTFAHEYMHMLDLSMPNRGALGAQYVDAARRIYQDGHINYEQYLANPLERSAHQVERMLCLMDVVPQK